MKRRWTSAVLAVVLATSALASPSSRETRANEAWRWLGNAPADDRPDVDEDDRELALEEPIELFGGIAADPGIRAELDADISFSDRASERLAEFFRGATVESVEPFLDSEQLLQQAARYADDPGIVAFLIAHGFDPNRAFGPCIPPESQFFPMFAELRAGPLHDAARYNANPDIVDALAEGGADVHATGGWDMYTPLHYAARHNGAAVVSALIRRGAEPNGTTGRINPTWDMSPDINGNAPLHVAVCSAKPPVVDALVAAGANVQQANSSGATPLHLAVRCGDAASISALVRHGADANAMVALAEGETEMHDCTGCNPIHLLVDSLGRRWARSDPERPRSILNLLLAAGADMNAQVAQHMYEGYSALRLAVASELGPQAVALLLKSGARADPGSLRAVFEETFQYSGRYAGAYGRRAVDSADNLRVLDLLIRHGVDVNAADSCQRTALHLAASAADGGDGRLARAVEKLVRAGADVNAVAAGGRDCDHLGATPLHLAAGRDAAHVASALLERRSPLGDGADVRAKDADGRLPLDIAAAHGHAGFLNVLLRHAIHDGSPRMVALLIERGAEVDGRDDIGWTPLHYALLGRYGEAEFLRQANVLLEHGADVDAATAAVGWTPLHLAARLDPEPDVLEFVQALIERGADVNARTRIGGWSPARVARASGEERERKGLAASTSSKAVSAAIQAAGGRDEGCDDAPMLPVHGGGGDAFSREDRARRRQAAVAPGCEYNLPFDVPDILAAGGRSVPGSFTAPGAKEALLFVNVGMLDGHGYFDLASLRDRHGAILPIMAFDSRTRYEGLCLDRETNTHAAVFRRSHGGSRRPEVDTAYYRYDADAGNFAEVLVDDREYLRTVPDQPVAQPTGRNAACRWRDGIAARRTP